MLTLAKHSDLLRQGEISRDTLCWCQGRVQWQCAEDIAELEAAFGTVKGAGETETKSQRQDLLDEFKQEIAALEKGVDPTDTAAMVNAPPSPEEKSFVDDDGTEYVWDSSARKYKAKNLEYTTVAPVAAANYDVETMTYEAEEEQLPSLEEARRLQAEEEALQELGDALHQGGQVPGGVDEKDKKNEGEQHKGVKRPQEQIHASDPSKTTSVYITGLPDDVTVQEVAEAFGKCGIIRQGEGNAPKIKLYRDKKTAMLKGDGLVTYLKRPSVELAVNILDGSPFRPGMVQMMKVQEAHFEIKGEYKQPVKPKKKPKKKGGRQENLLGWGGFDDHLPAAKVTVILKHMFMPEEVIGQPDVRLELELDIKEECEKLGPVDRVMIYESNPDGAVAVRFQTIEAADMCVSKMNGRYFAGRQLQAGKWDGFTRYNMKQTETEEEQAARLEQFSKDLENN